MEPIRSVALIVNATKAGASELAAELARFCEQHNVDVRVTDAHPLPKDSLAGCDACCVLGGDGTLLATVPEAIRHNVPVFGINRGKLGFLATLSADEAIQAFGEILRGAFKSEQRAVLSCETAEGECGWALNDIVIKHRTSAPILGLRVTCDGNLVSHYYCDGIIFSTPTGSTAYNLSAGGPIIHPAASVVAMTPICPHTLSNRSLIFPGSVELAVDCDRQQAMPSLSLDGRHQIEGDGVFPIAVSVASQTFTLLQPRDHSHFHILRSKLRWGGDETEED